MPKKRTTKPKPTPLPDAIRNEPTTLIKTENVISILTEWLAIAKGESSLSYANVSDLVYKIQEQVEVWVEELEAL